jgi:cysteine desulfurase
LNDRHYLDCASTVPLRPEAARAMASWIEQGGAGDPGRVHAEGRVVRDAIERARESVAALLGTTANRIVFTSGGTEAANAAIFAAGGARRGAPMICADVEHSCVREAARRSAEVCRLEVDSKGRIDLEHLSALLAGARDAVHGRGGGAGGGSIGAGAGGAGGGSIGAGGDRDRPALVNCQWCNHEVGTLQPVAEVVALCRSAGVPVHLDAAAAAGHVPLELDSLGADYVSVSAHKLGGPAGTGALFVRRGLRLEPFVMGGAQERARRGGLENVIGIVGFGAAAAALIEPGRLTAERATALHLTEALLEAATSVSDVSALGDTDSRVPHIVNVAVGGVLAEAVLLGLDRSGIAAHSGSACSSESIEPSPVLAAMGVDPDRSLRLSVGWSSTEADVEAFAEAFPQIVERLRALGNAV